MRELGRREERDEAPLHEDGEAVGEALDVAEVVRREEDRPPLAAAPLDEGVEGGEPLGVEGGRRLVEEEERRVGERGDREAEALDHSARVGRDGAGGGAVQAREPEDLGRAGRGNAAEAPVELHDLAPRQGVGKGDLLGEEGEAPARGRLRGGPSVDEDLPRRGVDEAGDGLEAGRLSRPVRPEERDDLAGPDLERDAVHGDLRAVGLSEAVEADHAGPLSHAAGRRRPRTRSAVPRRNVIEEAATAGRCAERAAGFARGTSGRCGGRARGELSIDISCLRTGKRLLGHADRPRREALREEVGGEEVPAEVVEDVPEAVRPVGAAVAVEVGLAVLGPVVPVEDGVGLPADERQGRQVPDEGVAGDPVLPAAGEEDDRRVGRRDDVPAEDVPVGVLEEDAARVVGEEVPLGDDVVARLEEEADGREAAVPAGTGSAGT